MLDSEYRGVLTIGDPHLESRIPGFRKDNYPRVVLGKVAWCLSYARDHELLPVFLGDMFHLPRDNANWLLGELMVLFHRGVLGVYGNHDVRQNDLSEDDSLDVLVKAGRYQLLDNHPWSGTMNGQPVMVGGTSWGQGLPQRWDRESSGNGHCLVLWMAHHDVRVPGYEEQGYFDPREVPGVNLVVNGHIHRSLPDFDAGSTVWMTPGNIARRQRSDATRLHVPSALQIDIDTTGWQSHQVEIPHKPFDEVFHETVLADASIFDNTGASGSAFVAGLAEMLARKTETSAGLMAFLELHLSQFDEAVANEIRKLAKEVTNHADCN